MPAAEESAPPKNNDNVSFELWSLMGNSSPQCIISHQMNLILCRAVLSRTTLLDPFGTRMSVWASSSRLKVIDSNDKNSPL